MPLGIRNPTWKLTHPADARLVYADPDWWGWPGVVDVCYEWHYHAHLVAAAKVLQRRCRIILRLRWAKEHLHWSDNSLGHLRWREEGCGVRRPRYPETCGDTDGNDGNVAQGVPEAKVSKADAMFLAAAYRGNEELVRTLLAKGANLDCVEGYTSPISSASVLHMPLDAALRNGHGEIACWILEQAGSGTMLRGMHPECVPSACSPRGLLRLCNEGASHLFTEWNTPTLNVRYHQTRQRRAFAKAMHTLLQSSHVTGTTIKDRHAANHVRLDERGYVMSRHWLVDARMPGALMGDDPQGWVHANSLLTLAWWAEHTDLAARLYLAGVRCTYSLGKDGVRTYKPREYVVRFVARAVVRTLLRRAVKTQLIAWYWAEAAARRKYAAPDAAGFEDDMAAPVFREGALGA